MKAVDLKFMRRALTLARRGLGRTSPNPCVGAVIVQRGRVLGEGWHRGAGLRHAEVEAFADARRRKIPVKGATLYVTLEPCCTWGRTPPCTEAIIDAGIHRVVAGAVDPNPKHAGKGFRILRMAGIKVVEGVMADECVKLNEGWNHWMTHRMPWVIAKCGMTLDGKIATANGESKWITSEASRHEAHRLRAQTDAILVGVNTVLKDDPHLNVRGVKFHGKQPLCVVLDSRARTMSDAKILKGGRACIITGRKVSPAKVARLKKAGAMVLQVRTGRHGLDLRETLRLLGKQNVTSVLVEGGGEMLGSFFQEKLVNEAVLFIAPIILGGKESVKAVAGEGVRLWNDAVMLEGMTVRRVGVDLMVEGKVGRFKPATRSQ